MARLGWKTWGRNAKRAGAEAGRNAAEWWEQEAIGGCAKAGTERSTAERVLRGIDECDPEILDALPTCDLSGQWADGLTEGDVYDAAGVPESKRECAEFYEGCSELLDVYAQAYDDAAQRAVVRACKRVLS